jgi:hypothetical protein
MYRIGNDAPQWIELLPGVEAQFRPISRAMLRHARRAMRALLEAADEDDADAKEVASEEFDRVLVRDGLTAWKGIGDANGKALKLTPESVEAFLDDPRLFGAACARYVLPFVVGDREKNGSPPSPAGISAGATRAKTIAGSAAKRKAAAAAKNAPTAATRPKATRAKASGKSSKS